MQIKLFAVGITNVFLWRYVSDGLGAECEPSVLESVRDEEEVVDEQKDDGKLGFCEIQWHRKFAKKNFKHLDDPTLAKLSLSITKIDEECDEDRVEIIPLTSPMKVRSPSGTYRPAQSMPVHSANDLTLPSKNAPVHFANIRTISQPLPPPETSSPRDSLRKSSLLSLKSLSMSLRLLKNRNHNGSLENVESTTLETIDETSRKTSIFKLDLFERNLKKFVTKSNEAEFQTYSEYQKHQQQQQQAKSKAKTYFKQQKVYDRRSSMSDIHEGNQNPRALHSHNHISTSSSNVKHETKKHKEEHKKQVDKTAEMLKEVRKRNMETAKRISAPRRISSAY